MGLINIQAVDRYEEDLHRMRQSMVRMLDGGAPLKDDEPLPEPDWWDERATKLENDMAGLQQFVFSGAEKLERLAERFDWRLDEAALEAHEKELKELKERAEREAKEVAVPAD